MSRLNAGKAPRCGDRICNTGGMRAAKAATVETRPTDEPDPLAGLALEYTTRSVRFLTTRSAALAASPEDAAAETILWLHSRIYFMTTRALVGDALAGNGSALRREDANVCAEEVLVAVERSRAALAQIRTPETECEALVTLLDGISSGMEARFPCVARRRRDGAKKKPPRRSTKRLKK